MWQGSCSRVFKGVKKEAVWQVLTDVNNWKRWDPDIEYIRMESDFVVGNFFMLKPKGAPCFKIRLIEVEKGKAFTDCVHFIGAKMYGRIEMVEENDGLRLTTTVKVTGILGFLWRKLVAEDVIKAEPQKMENIVALAKEVKI